MNEEVATNRDDPDQLLTNLLKQCKRGDPAGSLCTPPAHTPKACASTALTRPTSFCANEHNSDARRTTTSVRRQHRPQQIPTRMLRQRVSRTPDTLILPRRQILTRQPPLDHQQLMAPAGGRGRRSTQQLLPQIFCSQPDPRLLLAIRNQGASRVAPHHGMSRRPHQLPIWLSNTNPRPRFTIYMRT